MSKKIILISDQPDDVTFAAHAAVTLGSEVLTQPNIEASVDDILREHPVAVFLDASEIERLRLFESTVQNRVGLFSSAIRPAQIHLLSNSDLSLSRDLVLSSFFGNFLERHTKELEQKGAFYGKVIEAMNSEQAHEVQRYLNQGADVQTVKLTHTAQKQEAVEEVRQYLIAAKIPGRIANLLGNAVDELLMNALFDAPADDFGKPIYSATARTQARELGTQEQVEMSIGFDGARIVIRVTDQFGSIDRQRLLNHVSVNYRETSYTIKAGQAGAGLGIASVYNSGASLFYSCTPKLKTHALLTCNVFPSYRDFKAQFKFFSAHFKPKEQ